MITFKREPKFKLTKSRIEEFFERLEGPEGCDFKIPHDGLEEATWKCGGGIDKSRSISILKKMGISQDEYLAFLAKCHNFGGHCDCEIIFNARDNFINDMK